MSHHPKSRHHPHHPHHRPLPSHTKVRKNQLPAAHRAGDKINYNVLKCRPVLTESSPQVAHDHLQVLLEIDGGTNYWMTINIRNGQDKVFYVIDEAFTHPITHTLHDANLPDGFTAIDSSKGADADSIALDYIRKQLVDVGQMDEIEASTDPNFDGIADALTTQLSNVSRSPNARLYIFGSKFTDGARFSTFGIDEGIHDIHMNQGSKGGHASSNGIYQDGALLAYYPSENRWSAVFLKFESQAEFTDENGNAAEPPAEH